MTLARTATALALLVGLALSTAACASGPRGGADRLPGPLPAEATYAPVAGAPDAPDIDGRLIDRTAVDLETLAAGRPLIVQFMASWCTTCAEQQSVISTIADEYGDAVAIAQVSGDTDTTALTTYLDEHQVTQPVVVDPDLQVWRSFAVTEPPMTALIDADGHLVKLWPTGADADRIRAELDEIVVTSG
ncbi:TlpA family protein disulfide reductase [Agromyces endophyticus]|uniref:TlpA family protein disulfide reductase n=1 Tax=Agromyces sp. H17E-10 TaxID=2932244 RepID=UPI001FD21B56|nr:TlpA disulfide reductase family protein [Agromyces sp. H17E-10]UOQ89350.1 TlpA family protein disulfide reductase [Agromyces sp. H17E-10]